MKIVVLDGHTLNPGDLSWAPLQALGECEVYPRTPYEHTVARAAGAEIVLTNKAVLDRPVLGALPQLRYIGVTATGYNIVDVQAAREQGIVVTNVPDYGTDSVAQLTFALLLELALHVGRHAESVRQGAWTGAADFSYTLTPLIELHGLTMGIVGFGRIGQAVARLAQAFGMKVLAHTPHLPKSLDETVEFLGLDELFSRSDVVSLHCPLTPLTRHLVNAERLARMKPTAFLLNTGRGPLVDDTALAHALNTGQIAGAGLDVLSVEPPPADQPLLAARNCLITPHLGWATRSARERLLHHVIANVRAYLAGVPQNVVS